MGPWNFLFFRRFFDLFVILEEIFIDETVNIDVIGVIIGVFPLSFFTKMIVFLDFWLNLLLLSMSKVLRRLP